MRSVAPHWPCRLRPRCSGPSSAYCSIVSMPAMTPPRDCASGLPPSRLWISASSPATARSRRAAAFSAAPRAAGAVRAQSGAALRAAASAASASAGQPAGTSARCSPVDGSVSARTASSAEATHAPSMRLRGSGRAVTEGVLRSVVRGPSVGHCPTPCPSSRCSDHPRPRTSKGHGSKLHTSCGEDGRGTARRTATRGPRQLPHAVSTTWPRPRTPTKASSRTRIAGSLVRDGAGRPVPALTYISRYTVPRWAILTMRTRSSASRMAYTAR